MPVSLASIYDYETPIEEAFAYLFGAAGISIYTPANAAFVTDEWKEANPDLADYIFSAEDEFQKQRPRLQLMVQTGAATKHLETVSGKYRCDAFTGQILLLLVTDYNVIQHRAYRAQIRAIMSEADVDTSLMPHHDLEMCVESGTSNEMKSDDGLMESTLSYDILFNIRPTSWSAGV